MLFAFGPHVLISALLQIPFTNRYVQNDLIIQPNFDLINNSVGKNLVIMIRKMRKISVKESKFQVGLALLV